MEYLCTSCCKKKCTDEGLLPASQRYISERIGQVLNESIRLDKPLLILSGRYGFIDSDHEIPRYDQKLEPGDVARIVPLLVSQLREKGVSKTVFIGRPRTTPGWKPYYDALEQAFNQLGILVTFQQVDIE